MAYIGVQPRLGNFQACDAISTSATDTFNLLVGGVAIFPQTAQHCLVSLNGVLQAPISSYTISGSTIVFASALTSSDSIDFITILGDTLDLGTPSDSTVTTAKLVNSAVDLTSKVTGALPVANGGTALTSGFANGITEADMWRITSGFSGAATPISSNWERADTEDFTVLGTGLSQSSGVFTFPSTGYYFITFQAAYSRNGDKRNIGTIIQHTTDNGSNWTEIGYSSDHIVQAESDATMTTGVITAIAHILDVSNDKVRFSAGAASVNTTGDTNAQHTGIVCIKLADT